MKDLYIIGAGGFGREVAWLVERINADNNAQERPMSWTIRGFIDDNEALHGCKLGRYVVVGGCKYLNSIAEDHEVFAVCAVGSSKVRKKIIEGLSRKIMYPTVIDPSVLISDSVEIGEGSIICAGTILTVDIKIGKHVILNLSCTVGHDAVLHDYVTVYPSVNISGNVDVGECCEIGTGMQVIQGKKIGASSIVGAGAVVTKDITESGIYVGVPARLIKSQMCEGGGREKQ